MHPPCLTCACGSNNWHTFFKAGSYAQMRCLNCNSVSAIPYKDAPPLSAKVPDMTVSHSQTTYRLPLPEITDPDQLQEGAYYELHLRSNILDENWSTRRIERCERGLGGQGRPGWLYFANHIWATKDNPQAFQKWRIFGPVPMMTELPPELTKPKPIPERWDCIEFTKDWGSDLDNLVKKGSRYWVLDAGEKFVSVISDGPHRWTYGFGLSDQDNIFDCIAIGPRITDAEKAMAWCRGANLVGSEHGDPNCEPLLAGALEEFVHDQADAAGAPGGDAFYRVRCMRDIIVNQRSHREDSADMERELISYRQSAKKCRKLITDAGVDIETRALHVGIQKLIETADSARRDAELSQAVRDQCRELLVEAGVITTEREAIQDGIKKLIEARDLLQKVLGMREPTVQVRASDLRGEAPRVEEPPGSVSIKDLRDTVEMVRDGLEVGRVLRRQDVKRYEHMLTDLLADWPEDKNLISDGHHTFGELYAHRMTLFVMLQHALVHSIANDPWWTRRHHPDDDPMFEGMVLAGITLGGRLVTYHLRECYIPLLEAAKIPEAIHAPKFDGHTPQDVLERIEAFIRG